MCFPITGYLTASAKDCTGLARAICSRNDGTTPDCRGALRGKRSLNEKENWRRVELNRGEETRVHEVDSQLMEDVAPASQSPFHSTLYYVISDSNSGKPSHSSSSSSSDPDPDSRSRFAPLLCSGSSRRSTSPSARVTQVNRLPFESYWTTGDVSTMSISSLKLGGGRSDRS